MAYPKVSGNIPVSSRMTPWSDCTVDQLVRAALSYRTDCSEEDGEPARDLAARETVRIAAVADAREANTGALPGPARSADRRTLSGYVEKLLEERTPRHR